MGGQALGGHATPAGTGLPMLVDPVNPAMASDWEHAARLFSSGQFDAARGVLESMLARAPRSVEAWLALTQVDFHTNQPRLAVRHAQAAAGLEPANPKLLCDVAAALLTIGEVAAARGCLERAAAMHPNEVAVQQHLAMQYQNAGEHAAALAWLERARTSGAADPVSRFRLAIQLTFHDRLVEAEAELEACTAAAPGFGQAWAQLSQLRRQTFERNHLVMLEQALAHVQAGTEGHAALEFARYKEFEDLGRHEDAWRSLACANALMHGLLRHDSAAEGRTFESLRTRLATLPLPAVTPRGHRGPVPIFIVGLPRSGTTLLDRLLSNHPAVCSAGELGTFRRSLERAADCFTGPMLDEGFVERLPQVNREEAGDLYLANSQWRAGGHRFYVDKMPRNWLLVPLIHAAIPEAPILHMTREPTAVAFSNLRSYFGADYAYGYNVETLILHYRRYRTLMKQWHAMAPGAMLDVSYEALVADPDRELRRVFGFCGLEWRPEYADLARNKGPVATLSAVQVRGGIRGGADDRWRHYASHLQRLREGVEHAT